MDALQWMGAVRMRVQTADKITIIHTTPVHQLMLCEEKSCVFVRNKSIIKTFFTLNHHFWPKYESIIHNDAPSSEKVKKKSVSHIKIHLHICLELFWTVFAWKWCLVWAYLSPEVTFFWTLILMAPIHRGFIAEQAIYCYISPNLMKKHSSTSWMTWGRVHFHFGNYYFKSIYNYLRSEMMQDIKYQTTKKY